MNGYSIALLCHLASLLLATVAATHTTSLAIGLRSCTKAGSATRQLRSILRTVRLFPVAVLGLLASGSYMVHLAWSWANPWLVTSIIGLALILVLGPGIEGRRNRNLQRELETAGLTERAQDMVRDPVAWCAKMTTLTLMLAIIFLMTIKPGAIDSIALLVAAILAGVAAGLPFSRKPMGATLSSDAGGAERVG